MTIDKEKLLTATIPLEKELREKIYSALQGDIVNQLFKIADVIEQPNYIKSIFEGSAFKVDETLMKNYYDICYGVKETLGFADDIDFYIESDSSINACAIYRSKDSVPHTIVLNSGLVQLMDENELRFVVGHEIGHLIENHSSLTKLIDFVYPANTNRPFSLVYKISLWNQLSELECDRYGYLAMPNQAVCIRALFKLTSGLDMGKIKMDVDALLTRNKKSLEFLLSDNGTVERVSHPVNPIRIESLNLYSKLDELGLEQFRKEMDVFYSSMTRVSSRPIDIYYAQFIAAGGLIIAASNENITEKEHSAIISKLSGFLFSPKEYIEDMYENQDVWEVFTESIKRILEISPDLADSMLEFLISIALVDGEIDQREVDTVMGIGEDLLGFTKIEIAQMFGRMIQTTFEANI